MAKFKVGDKVKYVGNDDVFEQGEILTVKEDDGGSYRPLFVTGSHRQCNQWIFYYEVKADKPTKKQRISALESQVAELQAEVAALKKAKATPKFEAVTTDNIAVGDKIRVIDADEICGGYDLTDGILYDVVKRNEAGGFYVVDDITDDMYIATCEFKYVEKLVSE